MIILVDTVMVYTYIYALMVVSRFRLFCIKYFVFLMLWVMIPWSQSSLRSSHS